MTTAKKFLLRVIARKLLFSGGNKSLAEGTKVWWWGCLLCGFFQVGER